MSCRMNATLVLSLCNVATWVCLSTQVSFPLKVKCSFFSHKNQELFIASEQVLKDQPSLMLVSDQDPASQITV